MKCPSCNKFAAYDANTEPEVELEVTGDVDGLEITGTVRIVLTSECCGDELKENTFEVDHHIEADQIRTHIADKLAEEKGVKVVTLNETDLAAIAALDMSQIEWGEPDVSTELSQGGTGKKSTYGHETSGTVGAKVTVDEYELELAVPFELSDYVLSNEMEELN